MSCKEEAAWEDIKYESPVFAEVHVSRCNNRGQSVRDAQRAGTGHDYQGVVMKLALCLFCSCLCGSGGPCSLLHIKTDRILCISLGRA